MKINKSLTSIAACLLMSATAIGQQVSIPRIDQMPNKPSTYKMLDWKKLATNYDNLVFDVNKTGTYLPLTSISKEQGVNFSEIEHIKMSTFVGHPDRNGAEAINVMPAVVGASLVGVDKTNHLGTNWVTKLKDFFNKKNGQNVYLNNYSANTGGDWWYEVMPNVYFYQLYSLYPNADTDFKNQIVTIADRQLDVLYKLGGTLYPWNTPNMNHRAFDLIAGLPNSNGVAEPETAGSIAWLLYQAYLHTSDARYKQGAELALDFLQSWTSNPSYELQLPYGIITAARLNAEEGTKYDITKFMNWTFSSGHGTLRNWGTIVGKWNGYDMSGLIGEAMDGGNDYAFVMNGFQHAAALAPVAKYDKQYAKALGKWILNLASASRHFYPEELPQANQEATALTWAKENDANRCIPYEAMKQTWEGKSPYSMGDALRNGWAATDLSLYSGSSVGYLASLISPTNVDGILQIDLNVTDFEGENTYPNYLYYNPNAGTENITLTLPSGNHDVYDAISETVLKSNASGSVSLTINSDAVLLLVIYPSGSTTVKEGNALKVVNGGIIDFHSGNSYNSPFRVKAFSGSNEQIKINEETTFHCQVENADGAVTYKWYVNNTEIVGATNLSYKWTTSQPGRYTVKAEAINKGTTLTTQELKIDALGGDYVIPEISAINLEAEGPFELGASVKVEAITNAPNATISWTSDGGTLANANGLTPTWTVPNQVGVYTLTLTLKNALGEVKSEKKVQVIDPNSGEDYIPVIYYPFNGNTKNVVQNAFHATLVNAVLTNDAKGTANSAYRMQNGTQYIYTPNATELNFTDQMTLSFWIKPEQLGTEQYVISHGSWEDRFKISISPEKRFIMTLNTSKGIIDMADDTEPLVDGQFRHYTIVYTGTSLDMYREGTLVATRAHSGTIGKTSAALVIGRKSLTEEISFKGVIDEFRLYNVAVSPEYAKKLHEVWDFGSSNDISIKTLLVNGEEWDIEKNYVLPCGSPINEVSVSITPSDGATVDIGNNVTVQIDKPSTKKLEFTVVSLDGSQFKTYTLNIVKPFEFNTLVSQKWNNVLTVNNNSETNGGHNFVSYKWFKNGELVGTKQYYSAGKKATDLLDPNAEYVVEVTTDKGEVMESCATKPTIRRTSSFVVYPSPAATNESISVYADLVDENIQSGKLYIYSLSGTLVYQQDVNDSLTTFSLPTSGTYALKLVINNTQRFNTILIVK